MSPLSKVRLRVEPFAGRSTAQFGGRQNTEQRVTVRAEGEEGHGVDGLIRQSWTPGTEVMNPLGWDDADSGALTIERVDRICESRPAFMAGLMVEVMNPLGWAFTALLFLGPSVGWLAVSPEREAPGWDFVRWLM
jgi:hypothetical protein